MYCLNYDVGVYECHTQTRVIYVMHRQYAGICCDTSPVCHLPFGSHGVLFALTFVQCLSVLPSNFHVYVSLPFMNILCNDQMLAASKSVTARMQGDFDEDGDQGGRFRGKPLEPYTKPLADE